MREAPFFVKMVGLSCNQGTESKIGKAAVKWSISVGVHDPVVI
jgi:hypothetical protein